MKFCPVVPEICHGQVHGARKERRITRTRTRIIIIIIRNGAKTISLQTLFGRLNNQSKCKLKYDFTKDEKQKHLQFKVQIILYCFIIVFDSNFILFSPYFVV